MKWLFLVHQVQTPNSRERVKVWRMTKKVGAILYRNSVYVLPYSRERVEDFQWLSQQIRDSKGEASVFVSDSPDEKEDKVLRGIFEQSKKEEYSSLLKSIESLTSRMRQLKGTGQSVLAVNRTAKECKQLQEEFISIQKTDFFDHSLAVQVGSALKSAMGMVTLMRGTPDEVVKPRIYSRKDFQRKIWSTREHIHIDRVCSAWLIRRFIDPKARFFFAPEAKIPKGTIPFDVLGAEFSHHGDNCSFETLLRGFQIKDPALESIGQIVHDIDLKDQKFGRPEASGLDLIIRSLSDSLRNDQKTLEVGSVLFDALYHYLSSLKKKRLLNLRGVVKNEMDNQGTPEN